VETGISTLKVVHTGGKNRFENLELEVHAQRNRSLKFDNLMAA
jgi:hypothetical protein